MYLCQAPGGMVARGSGCAHRFSPKLRQPRHRFRVGLKGCRQQHLSPKPFIKKNNNSTKQNNALSESGNGRDMRGMWRVGG